MKNFDQVGFGSTKRNHQLYGKKFFFKKRRRRRDKDQCVKHAWGEQWIAMHQVNGQLPNYEIEMDDDNPLIEKEVKRKAKKNARNPQLYSNLVDN